jgi:hypothetical protein
MINRIDADHFCSAGNYRKEGHSDCLVCSHGCESYRNNCGNYHRNHPTEIQYKEEYGEDVPDDMAVWEMILDGCHKTWRLMPYWGYKQHIRSAIEDGEDPAHILCVIACTPFPQPPDKWRP